jgi:hypothetical protein
MGNVGSKAAVSTAPEVTESKSSKVRAINAIECGDRWRAGVVDFFDACEKCSFTAALWAEVSYNVRVTHTRSKFESPCITYCRMNVTFFLQTHSESYP